jgi:hypothetical protein
MNSEFGKTRLDNEAIEADWRERLSNDVPGVDLSARNLRSRAAAGQFHRADDRGQLASMVSGHIRISRKLFEIRGKDGRILLRVM